MKESRRSHARGAWCLAVSGAAEETVRVLDLTNGREAHTLYGHMGLVNAVALSEDGRRAGSDCNDRLLRV